MSIIKSLEIKITNIIKSAGYDVETVKLCNSSRPEFGEYQINEAMAIGKKIGKNPREVATDIVNNLNLDNSFTNINIAGPGFINITLSDSFLLEELNKILNNVELNIDKQDKKKIILDYGGANVAKALHVGHLRSANIGEALKRLARLLGQEVLGDAHLGDYGRPLGLVILEIKKMYPDLPYFDPNYCGDYSEIKLPITNEDLEKIYPLASTKSKEDEQYLEEAREITVKLQNHERGYYDLWEKVVSISKEEIKQVYERLNVYFDLWKGESDAANYFDELKDIFEKENVLEESNNALIIDVKKEEDNSPMPPLLFIKSNGSISYETTDLATILERKKLFSPDEIWYCVDGRQELHFEQVFRAARKANLIDNNVKLTFIGFGTMNGQDGKPFKTRDGGVMTLKSLIDLVKEETLKRINPETVKEEEKEEVATNVAIAALKYADFLPFRAKDYIFDVSKFADLEGKTGPYLLYSTIRMKSLLQKVTDKNITFLEIDKNTRDVIKNILNLSNVLTSAYQDKSLNDIAEYLYKLTSSYNKFYAENRVLTEENPAKRISWIALTSIVYDINTLLLETLAIEIPNKM